MRWQFWTMIGTVMLCGSAGSARGADAPPLSFNRDVRPILADRCFACHGPDAANRKANLRLDLREDALKVAKSGERPIVPGKPEASELVARLHSDDETSIMPPPETNKPLKPAEKAILERWIREGATYEAHWAFLPPKRPPVPRPKSTPAIHNPIDAFVLQRLQSEGFAFAPQADRETLIRRVTFTLTGLPPTVEEIDAFLNDKSPNAYEKVVDRLLASPRYGERMALLWLDAARYADTHGYQTDQVRQMWPWRDWVIRSFNRNQPFDQFTVEQLAGDLIPNATLDQKIATGFNRNHRISEEGGIIDEELRTEYVIDRVATTSTVWMGLTVACAQCHDHKYDPISQREYYQLFAFFNNVNERGNAGGTGNAAPVMSVLTPELEQQRDQLQKALADARTAMEQAKPKIDAASEAWEQSALKTQPAWQALVPTILKGVNGTTLTKQTDGSVLASGTVPSQEVYEFTATTPLTGLRGISLETIADPSLPLGGAGRFANANFVLGEIEVTAVSLTDPKQSQTVKFNKAIATYSQAGFAVATAIDGNPDTGWAVDGPTRKSGDLAVFTTETPFGFVGGSELRVKLKFQYDRHSIGRFRLAVSADANVSSQPIEAMQLPMLLATPKTSRTDAIREKIRTAFLASPDGTPFRKVMDDLTAKQTAVTNFEKNLPTTMVMADLPKARETRMLMRGQYDKPGDPVEAAMPAIFPKLTADAPKNRLGLAQSLVGKDHPLTARVAVNRFWAHHFGTGLVKTQVDFGVQGEWPSHPELLDWLAVEFMESGWDVKKLHRQIVMSSTFQQSSRVTPAMMERDPENRLLARGPRFRLLGEEIRDTALSVSGLLVEKIGGPPVKPYQPAGLWEELTFLSTSAGRYTPDTGEGLYRRSLYTFWKRTIPPPTLATFDAPTREFCTVARSRTNTPLQALALLNDPTFVEAARVTAQKLLADGTQTPAQRLERIFRQATGRKPSPAEMQVLLAGLERRKQAFARDPKAIEPWLQVGSTPRDAKLDPAELAAYTSVVSVIFNLDETVTRE
ncbi:PSD1 and planctomycete cytochrome C domain-containing protein [Tuwongella immobilis]|uniref:Cytochrome c domain-containing protein n=1 Tax=Tuwongella immobilis TaxID=692036 RepID=A0A6C2YTH4_9BACT|nr:PSD1 and planctomycete cytochrome C domain-containing protein [Tuwongella immobilis]VIP04215.1 secreted protein containing duf1549 : Putative uncharacterized protein OS=uncultured Planctomycetales bacterium HF0130_29M04 PE=4 SV=1: PSCyt1: PSCyt2: PSD1 [Tuwongella immobilis]VTS05794.1 secreted protein containing duf1549 : Putative uncharacterized protein OS=uncultured Planctomycetales bacterium HF0130_29M04 PE=4 SV=1: PSCyt1: PSCyt2: PSD1 [Tuwongella immobilis]